MSLEAGGDGFGRWDGPLYGERGILADDGERVECHCCGRWFHHLGRHVVAAHGLTTDEYREAFGLNRGTGLAGVRYRAKQRVNAARQLHHTWATAAERVRAITPEQRRINGSRTWRAEAKKDPHNQAVQRELSRRGAEKTRAAIAAGTWQRPVGRNPQASGTRGSARFRELLADPAWKAAWAQKVSAGRGGRARVTVACVICGTPFETSPTAVRRGYGKICGPACRRECRAQALREHHSAKQPDVAATRRRTGLQRWQDTDAYRALVARLRALPPEAFTALPERERTAVRLYYRLEEGAGAQP